MKKQFYDDNYYLSHYGKILKNQDYYNKITRFWHYNIFEANHISTKEKKILDFGAGLGQVTSAIKAECYDPSDFAINFLIKSGRIVHEKIENIPLQTFDYVLSSHSMEHALQPSQYLNQVNSFIKEGGKLILLLPVEKVPGPVSFSQDENLHFYVWNFQNLTNLLIECGFTIKQQKILFGPLGLSYLNNMYLISTLGKLKGNFPSLFCVAQKN